MSSVALAFSILAGIFSTSSLIGFPAETYHYGIQMIILCIATTIAPIAVGLYFPAYHKQTQNIDIIRIFQITFRFKSIE